MALKINICFVLFVSSIFAYPPPIYYEHDGMGWNEKKKIIGLAEELLIEAMLDLRQIVEIRMEHDKKTAYAVGMIMGRVREKYRFMLETYRDIVVSYHNLSVPVPPGVKKFRPFHYIIALEMMHYLELEIDKLIDVIIEEADEDIQKNRAVAGEEERVRKSKIVNKTNASTPAAFGFTEAPELGGGSRAGVNRLMEEAEKSLMRQRFLMKKLGYPVNMTTLKKRFLRRWPVEDSWSLGRYNQDYK